MKKKINIQISIKKLSVERLDQLCKKNMRTRSNMIEVLIKREHKNEFSNDRKYEDSLI